MNKQSIIEIAEFYGFDEQSRQCIEEMAELTVALNKMWREGMKTDYFYSELKKNDINHSTIEFEVKKCENITCNIDNNNLHNHIHHH